jgi:hypothetical protein
MVHPMARGAACALVCQGVGARGSMLVGFAVRDSGAVFRGGPVLRQVHAASGPRRPPSLSSHLHGEPGSGFLRPLLGTDPLWR